MGIFSSAIEGLDKNKRWVVSGAILYLIPVFYRLFTKDSIVPIINGTLFLYHKNFQVTPVNLEMIGLTFLIPCAVGAIVGNSFLESLFERRFAGVEKYLSRVFGSLAFAFLWISLHFFGHNFFNPSTPWGNQLWSGSEYYVRNLLLALFIGPLIPYLIELIHKKFKKK